MSRHRLDTWEVLAITDLANRFSLRFAAHTLGIATRTLQRLVVTRGRRSHEGTVPRVRTRLLAALTSLGAAPPRLVDVDPAELAWRVAHAERAASSGKHAGDA